MRRKLEAIVRSRRASSGLVQRVRIVLLASGGVSNASIARQCQCVEHTVRKWRARFEARPKLQTLKDDPRTSRPAAIPMFVRLELVKLACDRPAKCKLPFREVCTIDTLRLALHRVRRILVSKTEIRRILADEEIRPHHVRLWLHSPDPDFPMRVPRDRDREDRPIVIARIGPS